MGNLENALVKPKPASRKRLALNYLLTNSLCKTEVGFVFSIFLIFHFFLFFSLLLFFVLFFAVDNWTKSRCCTAVFNSVLRVFRVCFGFAL